MFWRKRTNEEEIDELQGFVEGMKRGQTLPTGDSLLETLRQIHDRREMPVVGHDHKRMLAERLRREMRVRAGQAVDDTVRVPSFAPAPTRRRFLEWAVAASVVFHVALGVVVLEHVHFGGIFGNSAAGELAEVSSPEQKISVTWVPPIDNGRVGPNERKTVQLPASTSQGGRGHEGTMGPLANASSPVPSASSAPVGPPVAPGGNAPIVPSYNASGFEGPADLGLAEGAGPSGDPMSEVLSTGMGRPEPQPEVRPATDFDVPVKVIFKPKPIYPMRAQEAKVKGTVKVSALFAADGTVREIKVVLSKGWGLDEEAIDAVRRMKFSPATRGGVPVSVRMTVNVGFGLL